MIITNHHDHHHYHHQYHITAAESLIDKKKILVPDGRTNEQTKRRIESGALTKNYSFLHELLEGKAKLNP